ncbi:MAG: transposase [Patescibacteria group bacterium]
MPGRDVQLVNEVIYHVLNRGINSQKIFNCERDYFQFLNRIQYYQNKNLSIGYSALNDLPIDVRNNLFNNLLSRREFLVEIIAYCLMPNHFHLLLRQEVDNGISKYLSNLTNSYTRYYNLRLKRIGPIVQGKFKAVQIINDEQLLHLSRYIHLNPYSAGVVKNLKELFKYPYSSLSEYISNQKGICQANIILQQFKDKSSYKKFIIDQADYQRNLQVIKKQILEF